MMPKIKRFWKLNWKDGQMGKNKKAEVVILITDKVEFKPLKH